ncbi:hypothetical protein Taro_031270 [Colocasia esculenta]|uniref:Uncharacterized protein n=1 Tax=Colocasia esculenta TaxID=4460 RepID=A0A843VPM1_COLES|nr:hypothetical protein [Colocasia esculenta]
MAATPAVASRSLLLFHPHLLELSSISSFLFRAPSRSPFLHSRRHPVCAQQLQRYNHAAETRDQELHPPPSRAGLNVVDVLRERGLLDHRAVAVVGGATGRVGDPLWKSPARAGRRERNSADIREIISRILGKTSGSTAMDVDPDRNAILERNLSKDGSFGNSGSCGSFMILDNYNWWEEMRLLDFLREVGRFARVGSMLAKESVKKRLASEEGMSYTEFTYQLL